MDHAPHAAFAAATDGTDAAAQALALLRRFIDEGFNASRAAEVVDELFAPDYAGHLNGDPLHGSGPRRPLELVDALVGQFPDIRATMRDAVAAGDRVAARFEIVCTHARTGRTVRVHAIWLLRVAGGKLAEGWLGYDTAALLRAAGYGEG